MAITVTGLPSNNEVISTYNPNLITFSSSSATVPSHSVIVISVPHLSKTLYFTITPNSNNEFSFDFQSIISDVTKEAENYLEPQFQFPDISTPTNSLFLDGNISTDVNVDIAIFSGGVPFDTTSLNLFFIKASRQILESNLMPEYSSTIGSGGGFENILVPFVEGNQSFKVWQGFPVEFAFDNLTNNSQFVQPPYSITTSLIPDTVNRFTRMCLIDHLGNELSPLFDNNNNDIEINLTGGLSPIDVACFVDYNLPNCPDKSKYFRFLNSNGGLSYYLFEDVYSVERQRSNKKRVNRRQTALQDMPSRSISLGNETTEVLFVSKSNTDEIDNVLLNELIASPMIQIWEGGQKWRRVDMLSNSGKLSTKQIAQNYSFTFDLGTLYNQNI